MNMNGLLIVVMVSTTTVLFGSTASAAPVPKNLSAKECLKRGISIQKTKSEQAAMRDALPLYDRAIALDPILSEAYLRAGAIRLAIALKSNSRKRLESAISLLSHCAELEPKQSRCHILLGNAYGFKGDQAGAQKSYKKACVLGESHWCEVVRSGKAQPSIEEFYKTLPKENRLNPKDITDIP